MKRAFTLLVLPVLFCAAPAFAQCASPAASEGDIIYNTNYKVHQYCNGSAWVAFGALNPGAGGSGCGGPTGIAGDLMYNSAYHVLQYCDGDDWKAVGGTVIASQPSGPSDCPSIGSQCADGTIFAGIHSATYERLFIPPTDQGTTSRWKTSTGVEDIATDSATDGRANTSQIPNSATFPAFKLCKDLTTGGHTDWYLPSQVEVFYLWSVKSALNAGPMTDLQNAYYWSSTETGAIGAWNQDFQYGNQDGMPKTDVFRVRCLRR